MLYHFVRLSCIICVVLTSASAAETSQKPLEYGRDVRPILAENCFHCHGQDSKKRMAGLRLDEFESATAKRGDRAALVPHQPDASGIYQRITAAQPARRMPPVSSNRSLTTEQIATLRRWIEEGGQYSKHWAFVPPKRPALPKNADETWAKDPIDAFILQRLETEHLRPSAAAAPEAWFRRVSLDLIGLPPTLAELDSFSSDVKGRGEAAYASTVDRLLASPRYGERMAMDWLDVARYADTHGFNNDSARTMWRWRDWVIDAFNANMPYDRFLTEQLAGDLLPNATLDQRIATGFGRNHVINSEGGIIDEEYRVEYVTDRVRTLGMAWLGLTLECAHCHDHKYDPITQKDHYRFYAFFNNVPELGEDGRVTNAAPVMPAPTSEQQRQMRALETQISKVTSNTERLQRSWKWRNADSTRVLEIAQKKAVPAEPALRISCDSSNMFEKAPEQGFSLAPGIAGQACVMGDISPKPLAAAPVPFSKRNPLTFSAWVQPAVGSQDASLLSSADYSKSAAGTTFGAGLDIRLVGGELEFRLNDRSPAYSIRVRSEGANIQPGQWHQVAVAYAGAATKDAVTVEASAVRTFVDGREIPTHVFNEGVGLPETKSDKAPSIRFRVGWDNAPGSTGYRGRLDEVAVWTTALSDAEIVGLFERDALPYAAAKARDGNAEPIETGWLRTALLSASNTEFAKQERELDRLRTEWLSVRRSAPLMMVMQEMTTPRETHVLLRGAYNAPGDKVEPAVPEELLGSWPANAPKNRLGLAQWLTQPDHPLTSRVVVNRFWQQLFGTGIVKTSDNFGLQGEWPSHPELLDWLARDFVESGWNVKALMRRMVLSATYRQDSSASPEAFAHDPENRLLARGPRFRLPAELLRDQALFLSGLLKNRLGGPSVYPYQPADLYKGIVVAANYPGTKYIQSTGDDLYRRSLYTFWKRTMPHPEMTIFDAPDREFCIVRRATTNTPLQALTLLNDPVFVEAARKLAERAFHEGGSSPDTRIAFLFRLATGRAPQSGELRVLKETLDKMLTEYRADEKAARALLSAGASPVDGSISVSELAAYTAVANMILNLDEVITKG